MKHIFILTFVCLSQFAQAGGGGCGDFCDKTQELLRCQAHNYVIVPPSQHQTVEDKRKAEDLLREVKPGFIVSFQGISWSLRKFDPTVLNYASVLGLRNFIISDQLKYPHYDHTQGYRIEPKTGAFQFAGFSPGGWGEKYQVIRRTRSEIARLTLTGITSKKVLMIANLVCNR